MQVDAEPIESVRRPIELAALKKLAGKHIWWKTADEALAASQRVIAQVMNIGDYRDVQELAKPVGDDVLRKVLEHAQPGSISMPVPGPVGTTACNWRW